MFLKLYTTRTLVFLKLYTIVMPRYGKQHSSDLRLQALSLVEAGIAPKEVARITGISTSTISRLRKKARDGGYNPEESTKLSIKQVEDRSRIGRPAIITTNKKASIVNFVTKNKLHREMNAVEIVNVYDVSATTILKILRRNKLKFCKNIKKPALTVRMKTEWLKWCIEHEDWILNDWKNVIWTDETNVVLNQTRDRRKIWRRTNEIYVKSVIRRRWAGYSEFMFWRCFIYDKKGSMHIWQPETAAEKKQAEMEFRNLNEALEAEAKQKWKINTVMRRTGLRRKPGKQPQWKFTKKTNKMMRKNKSGIDWWTYQKKILIFKFLPFVKKCMFDRAGMIIQKNNASSHVFKHQHKVFMDWNVTQLIWCANSSDLNAIKPCWIWLKWKTIRHGLCHIKKNAEEKWTKAWFHLSQKK